MLASIEVPTSSKLKGENYFTGSLPGGNKQLGNSTTRGDASFLRLKATEGELSFKPRHRIKNACCKRS